MRYLQILIRMEGQDICSLHNLDLLKLTIANQDVVLADCTYSTNKYNIPFLHLVGKQFSIYQIIIAGCYKGTYNVEST